jgi:hypothetical protein
MHAAALLSVTTGALMSISGPDMPLSWTDWSWDWRYRLCPWFWSLDWQSTTCDMCHGEIDLTASSEFSFHRLECEPSFPGRT